MTAPQPLTLATVEAAVRKWVPASEALVEKVLAELAGAVVESQPALGGDERVSCDTCGDTGLIDWMIEADPTVSQEADSEGKIPCPDCGTGEALDTCREQRADLLELVEVERERLAALRTAVEGEVDAAYRVGANYVLCGRLTAALTAARAHQPTPPAQAEAVAALWKAERAVYLLRMNTHRGGEYRDAIEDADRVIRALIIAATDAAALAPTATAQVTAARAIADAAAGYDSGT